MDNDFKNKKPEAGRARGTRALPASGLSAYGAGCAVGVCHGPGSVVISVSGNWEFGR